MLFVGKDILPLPPFIAFSGQFLVNFLIIGFRGFDEHSSKGVLPRLLPNVISANKFGKQAEKVWNKV